MCHFTSINFTKSKRNAEIKRVLKVFSSGYQLFPSSFIVWRVLDIFRIIKMFCFCLWVILWWYMDATRASHWWMKFFYHLHPLYFLETWWIYLFIFLEQIKSTLLSRCERFHTSFRRKCLLLCLLGIYMWVPVFKKKRIRKNITWIAQYKWTKVCRQAYLVWGHFSRALLDLHFKERHQCYHFILILLLETQVLLGSLCKCCVPFVKWWVTGPSIIPCPCPSICRIDFFCFL